MSEAVARQRSITPSSAMVTGGVIIQSSDRPGSAYHDVLEAAGPSPPLGVAAIHGVPGAKPAFFMLADGSSPSLSIRVKSCGMPPSKPHSK